MKKKLFFPIIMLVALCTGYTATAQSEDFRKSVPAPGPAPVIELGDSEQFELDNGLKVILVQNTKLPRVSFQLFVDAPDMMEGDKVGLSGFTGSLMSRGTKNRTKSQIDEEVDNIGATMSTTGSGIYASCLTKYTEQMMDVFTDVLYHPTFPEEELEKVRKQSLSSLAQIKNDANSIAANVRSVLVYGKDHPYGQVETEASVKNISASDCQAYHATYFKPNISYLIIVGDMEVKQAKKLATQYFGAWESGEVPSYSYDFPKSPQGRQVVFVDKPGAVQSVISVCYPVQLKQGGEDNIKARVMNTVFGGYFRSRLNNNLREDKGYTYGVRSRLSADKMVGSFNAGGSVRNEVTDSSLVEFIKEMEIITSQKMDSKELSLVKNYATGTFAIGLENPRTIANYALFTSLYDMDKDYYANYLKNLSKVDAGDVEAMAKKYIHPDNAYILVVGDKASVADKLVRFDSDGVIDFYDAFGNPVVVEAVAGDVDAKNILVDYVSAIGGYEKLKSIKVSNVKREANTAYGAIRTKEINSNKGEMFSEVSMNGNVMQKQLVTSNLAYVEAMGNKTDISKEESKKMMELSQPFAELFYLDEYENFEFIVSGIEEVDGQKAYKVEITSPMGARRIAYYAVDSKLKLKETIMEQNGAMTQLYKDYSEVEGVKLPKTIELDGGPLPMTLELKEAAFNLEEDQKVFEQN